MKKSIPFFIAGAALILSLLFYYRSSSDCTLVEVTQITRGDLIDYSKTIGRMEAIEEAVIRAKETGQILKVLVKKGDKVKAGDQLLLFDRMKSEFALKKTEVTLEQTKISIQEAKAKMKASARTYADPSELESTLKVKEDNYQQALITRDSAERSLKNTQELYNIGAESLLTLQEKKDQLKTAEIDLLKTKRELEDTRRFFSKKEKSALNLTNLKSAYESSLKEKTLAEVELELALQRLDRLTCISSLDGTVIGLEVKEGMVVSAGQPLMTIADTSRLQVRADVDELDAGKIKKGQKAVITFDAFPDQELQGQVTSFSPQAVIKGERTVVETIILMDEGANLLKIANQVDVKIIRDKKNDVLFVPLSAVHRGKNHSFVWLYQDKTVRAAEVTTGLSDMISLEITDGLKEEDQVVVNCLSNLKEGVRVKIRTKL